MNSSHRPSLTDALSRAQERVGLVLFRPFDLQRWLILGFGAWLASLGEGGFFGGGFGGRFNKGRRGGAGPAQALREGWNWVTDNLFWLVPAALVTLLILLTLGALLLWLSSRGQFILLHGVGRNRAEIAIPWSEYAGEAWSLFVFRLVLGLTGVFTILPLMAFGGWALSLMVQDQTWDPGRLAVGVLGIGAGMLAAIALAILDKLTRDFVVPIQFVTRSGIGAAWARFRPLLGRHALSIVGYLVVCLLLHLAAAVAVFIGVLLTCLIGGCLLALPYIGTVALLPLIVFFRAFSTAFLAGMDPGLDALHPPEVPGPAAA